MKELRKLDKAYLQIEELDEKGWESFLSYLTKIEENEYLEVEFHESEPFLKGHKNGREFRKMGNEVNIISSDSTYKQLRKEKKKPAYLFKEKVKDLEFPNQYRGVGWWQPYPKIHKFYMIADSFDGHEIYANEEIEIKLFCDEAGMAKVPSERGENDYEIYFKGLPSAIEEWPNITFECTCKDSQFGKFGQTKYKEEVKFCKHSIASFLKSMEKGDIELTELRAELNPFLFLKELQSKLDRTIVKTDRAEKLDKWEREIILWNWIAKEGIEF